MTTTRKSAVSSSKKNPTMKPSASIGKTKPLKSEGKSKTPNPTPPEAISSPLTLSRSEDTPMTKEDCTGTLYLAPPLL
eukprot:7879577-Ditylum_brightwellii.AAC.1